MHIRQYTARCIKNWQNGQTQRIAVIVREARFEVNHLKCIPGVNTETNNIQLVTLTSDCGAACFHSEIANNRRLGRVVGMPDGVLTLRGT